jgi:hypothetical protein
VAVSLTRDLVDVHAKVKEFPLLKVVSKIERPKSMLSFSHFLANLVKDAFKAVGNEPENEEFAEVDTLLSLLGVNQR